MRLSVTPITRYFQYRYLRILCTSRHPVTTAVVNITGIAGYRKYRVSRTIIPNKPYHRQTPFLPTVNREYRDRYRNFKRPQASISPNISSVIRTSNSTGQNIMREFLERVQRKICHIFEVALPISALKFVWSYYARGLSRASELVCVPKYLFIIIHFVILAFHPSLLQQFGH